MKCKNCGKEFSGRADKNFCSIQCRNQWHYLQHASFRKMYNRTNNALQTNHAILEGLIRSGKSSADISELEAIGFSRTFVTGHSTDSEERCSYRCFDILYCQDESKIYELRTIAVELP